MVGKKDISSNLAGNQLTMCMTMLITLGGSKNVTNSKIVRGKVSNLKVNDIYYDHDHNFDHRG